MHLLTPCCYEYLYECIHQCHHAILVRMYAFAIPYAIFMHIGSTEEITLLEFNEGEEGDQQEIPQAAAPEDEE